MRALPLGVVVAVALAFAGCRRDTTDRVALSQPPPRHATARAPHAPTSAIAVQLHVPYQMVADELEQRFPRVIPLSGTQALCLDERAGGLLPRSLQGDGILGRLARATQVCGDVEYEATLDRGPGGFTVSRADNGIRIAVPVNVEGRFGLAGALARIPGLGPRGFRGAVLAHADVELDLDGDWCPKVEVAPGFAWIDKAQLEIGGRFWIDIDAQVQAALDAALRQASAGIGDWLDCAQARALVEPYWRVHTVAATLPDGSAAHARIEPTGAAFSGLEYRPDAVAMAWQLDALVSAATGAAVSGDAPSRPLPALRRIPVADNALRVAVPLRVGYEDLSAMLTQALSKQAFTGGSRLGEVAVSVRSVEVYPSGDRLVFGVAFDADAGRGRALDAGGIVYLLGEPVLDVATQTLSVRRVGFSRIVDNRLWRTLSAMFRGRIARAIEQAAVLPLAPRIEAGRRAATPALEQAALASGLELSLRDDFVGLDRITLTPDAIDVEARLEGSAQVTLLALPGG